MKVNVWQVGYTTMRDYVLRNNAQCRNMGYVEIRDTEDGWEEDVWNLLNWSCWTGAKPENVHSPLDHCNSDVILQIEGKRLYRSAQFVGWKSSDSLEKAVDKVRDNTLWPFKDVHFTGGHTRIIDGKAYWQRDHDSDWIEITW